MNDINLTPSAVKNEASAWIEHLNQIIGVLCFTLGMATLGTKNPPLYGGISFLFVLTVHIPNRNKAKILKHLQSKKNLTELERTARKDILSRLMTLDLAPALFGYIFLSVIAFGWKLFEDSPEILSLIYGQP